MNYIIREADIEDAENVIEYIKIVSDETDFLISDSSERNRNNRHNETKSKNEKNTIRKRFFRRR